jgi:hypothetical protein
LSSANLTNDYTWCGVVFGLFVEKDSYRRDPSQWHLIPEQPHPRILDKHTTVVSPYMRSKAFS